jgi:hypothetical protein
MSTNEIITIGTIVLATVIGNGAIWQYGQRQLEKNKQVLERQQYELQAIAESVKLREKLNDIFYKITKSSEVYQEVLSKYEADPKAQFGPFNAEKKLLY